MILCFGEALIDMAPVQSTDGAAAFAPLPGGAAFNTAIALVRLGADVGLLSGISHDPLGEALCQALERDGVSTDYLIRSDRLTTLAMVHLQNGAATYSFYDEQSAGRMVAPSDIPILPAEARALLFGGISLVKEPAADAFADLLAREGAGRVVMLDPNIRTGFIDDETAYRARLSKMMAAADIIKVSDEDLAWLMDGDAPLEGHASAMLNNGTALVIVTEGADGARAFTAEGATRVPGVAVECVDTIGAGDTFNAGFLFELSRLGKLSRQAVRALSASDIHAALSTATKAAAISVSRAGANPPTLAEVEAL